MNDQQEPLIEKVIFLFMMLGFLLIIAYNILLHFNY